MDIYTAQYRYLGDDRMDITVKTAIYPGTIFMPDWDMVKALQAQKITEWEYAMRYMGLMAARWYSAPEETNAAIEVMLANRKSLTLVCFCPSNIFCHRILAARLLEGMELGTYRGERIIS